MSNQDPPEPESPPGFWRRSLILGLLLFLLLLALATCQAWLLESQTAPIDHYEGF
jgi:hypothetical protein